MTDDKGESKRNHELAANQTSGALNCKEMGSPTTADGSDVVTDEGIFKFLSENPKIVFKSQQIHDPDLTIIEKKEIAKEIYNSSMSKFLVRFGKYLEAQHLQFIQKSNVTLASEDDEIDEINLLIKNLLDSLKTHARDIKNRRYVALQSMIKSDSYFTDREMMKREPHLYEQMVGQYLTDAEKRIRDREDQNSKPFSSILLDNYDNGQLEKLRNEQAKNDLSDDDGDTLDTSTVDNSAFEFIEDDEYFPEVLASQRRRWGEFDSEPLEENPIVLKKIVKEVKFITAGERDLLRREFMRTMYENFLEGKDKYFDYSAVDENTEFDDLQQIEKDREDKYFEDNDDIGEVKQEQYNTDSDDELDVYMQRLIRHRNCQLQLD